MTVNKVFWGFELLVEQHILRKKIRRSFPWPPDSGQVQLKVTCLLVSAPNPFAVCVQRDTSRVKQLEEKLSAARRLLAQQKAQELSIQREHKKADTHKKMTEF